MRKFKVDRIVRTSEDESKRVSFHVLAVNGSEAARLADRAKLSAEAKSGLAKAPDKVRGHLTYRPRHMIKDSRIL